MSNCKGERNKEKMRDVRKMWQKNQREKLRKNYKEKQMEYKMHKKNKKNVANTEGKIKGKKICITQLIKTEIREESE